MYWQVEGQKPVVYGTEYTDDGRRVRRIGPVWNRIKMFGMIARLMKAEGLPVRPRKWTREELSAWWREQRTNNGSR